MEKKIVYLPTYNVPTTLRVGLQKGKHTIQIQNRLRLHASKQDWPQRPNSLSHPGPLTDFVYPAYALWFTCSRSLLKYVVFRSFELTWWMLFKNAHCAYSIQYIWWSLAVTCDRSVIFSGGTPVSSTNKTNRIRFVRLQCKNDYESCWGNELWRLPSKQQRYRNCPHQNHARSKSSKPLTNLNLDSLP
jgi:hypothetical protein